MSLLLKRLLCIVISISTLAGAPKSVPKIPNAITSDEYEVYSAWLAYYFKTQLVAEKLSHDEAHSLRVGGTTFTFDPIGNDRHCSADAFLSERRVDRSMLKAFHEIGEALYPIHVKNLEKSPLEISGEIVDVAEHGGNTRLPAHYASFSRVAFNAARTVGLFAFDRHCGIECGGGQTLLAVRKNGTWSFDSNSGCIWAY